MASFSAHNLGRSRLGMLFFVGLGLAMVLMEGGDLWAAKRRGPAIPGMLPGARQEQQGKEAAAAAQYVQETAEAILDLVANNQSLLPEEIQVIEEELKEAARFQGQFEQEEKAYLYLAKAFVAHFSGDAKEAMQLVQRALQLSPEDTDMSDSMIVLSLCYEKYHLARKLLRERGAGRAGQEEDESVASRWKREETRGTERGRQGRIAKGTSRSQGSQILSLPIEYMPYENLGKNMGSLQTFNVNGSYFHFEPGQGRVLCALLWQCPDEKKEGGRQSIVARSRRSRKPSRSTPAGTLPGMLPGMLPPPGLSIRARAAAAGGVPVPEVAYDLGTNLEQFTDLFGQGILTGKVDFVGVNLDPPNAKGQMVLLMLENAWPWVSFMAHDGVNHGQWTLQSELTPVMMMVDVKGKVRYVGPVGGFLPQMLMGIELAKAVTRSATIPSGISVGQEMTDTVEPTKQPFGLLPDEGSQDKDVEQSGKPAGEPNSLQFGFGQQPAEAEEVQVRESNPQAKSMLQAAYVQKRLTPRSALKKCEEVVEKYPDSLEAQEAELLIQSILRDNPRLQKEREEGG